MQRACLGSTREFGKVISKTLTALIIALNDSLNGQGATEIVHCIILVRRDFYRCLLKVCYKV